MENTHSDLHPTEEYGNSQGQVYVAPNQKSSAPFPVLAVLFSSGNASLILTADSISLSLSYSILLGQKTELALGNSSRD